MRLLTIAAVAVLGLALGGAWVYESDPDWYLRTRYPLEYEHIVRGHAKNHDLDPALLAAVIYAESRFDPNARSGAGAVGLMLAPGHLHPVLAAIAVLCIAIGAGAAGAINMWYERDIDALMARTRGRPIPAGRMEPAEALAFGVVLSIGSVMVMALAVPAASAQEKEEQNPQPERRRTLRVVQDPKDILLTLSWIAR